MVIRCLTQDALVPLLCLLLQPVIYVSLFILFLAFFSFIFPDNRQRLNPHNSFFMPVSGGTSNKNSRKTYLRKHTEYINCQ
ncbi:hypothetical protein L873DRAFT_1818805 [Choiromyces venosus 120613-1]|uniref:Uncharacterized protein n=1 Tax=Choiromyces venosus 120613-1 TaxID=1336337 RepID=A0A3N4J5S4_9PEZI|nr:hypothetical protein L873DRAFT_1818805 [Choiromyces venosus 120613-1]